MITKSVEIGNFVTPAGAKHRGVLDETELKKVWDEVGHCFGYLKPDGWRIQLHSHDSKINLFTRFGNDVSTQEFSNIANRLEETLGKRQFVLDVEVIGLDRMGRPTPLREMHKAARHVAMVLDALLLEGKDITLDSVKARHDKIIPSLSPYVGDSLVLAEYKEIDSFLELNTLYQGFLDRPGPGYDGVILKKYDTSYFTDAFKVKREITVDATILGVYLSGEGKAKGVDATTKDWANSLLLAVIDTQTNRWIPIGKVSGDDEDWVDVCEICKKKAKPGDVPADVVIPPDLPDLWIVPEIIVQITARTISLGAKNSYIILAEAPRDIFLRRDKNDSSLVNTFDQLLEMGRIRMRPPIPMGLF